MPRLYVVPTPIGNLEDMTLRALRVLREVPLILAEDTRHTRKLLTHFGISTPLLSYHQHNKLIRLDGVLQRLHEADAALVSSAGMPAVADPGFELVAAAVEAGIPVEVLPGPSAVIAAVVAAALPAPGFLFAGFLPRERKDRRRRLTEMATTPYSLVLYEAPHRLLATLDDLVLVLGDRPMAAVRELTKVHEEVVRGQVSQVRARFTEHEPRGEFTLVVQGAAATQADSVDEARAELLLRFERGESARQAVSEVALKYGLGRNQVYDLWVQVSARG